MKTTIQISQEEAQEIALLKEELRLPSQRAVVMEGVRTLRQLLKDQRRHRRLQQASGQVRGESARVNRTWAPLASPLKTSS